MSSKYKIRDQNALYFVTFTVINWLDVFTRKEYKDIFFGRHSLLSKEKMKKYFTVALSILFLANCSSTERKEKWIWNTQVFNPHLIKEGQNRSYGGLDTLRPGQQLRAKLYKDFEVFNDSNGNNIIKEFKGYFLEIAADTSKQPGVEYAYKNVNQFIKVKEDTALIDIPTDSLFRYDVEVLKWKAGYHIIFTDNADTTYMVGGKWILKK
jgi:hypothetical protein